MTEVDVLNSQVVVISYALDTFYFLVMGALVMWMAAGFTMLEAGLVRAKNTAEILTKNVGLFSISCVMYMLCGYSIMYPGDEFAGGFISSLSTLGSGLVSGNDNSVATIVSGGGRDHSLLSDFYFQVVFVATAMSIVSGAVAERMKLWSFFLFTVVLTGFIYPVQGFWKWGGGWLEQLGFLDFAGSGVVHLCGAAAALAGVLLLGPRKGKYNRRGQAQAIPGCNLPLATLGTFVLWLGWFGFNGGSVLRISNVGDANSVALVFVNTNMAAAGGLIGALLLARFWFGKADLTMVLNGALAGLVAVTAGPHATTPVGATLIGFAGGLLVVVSIISLDKLRIDDPVGAISVHGVVGIWGLLAVPIYDDSGKFWIQLVGLLCIFAWVFSMSLLAWLMIRLTIGIRVDEAHEYEGVDLHECGLEAYPEFAMVE